MTNARPFRWPIRTLANWRLSLGEMEQRLVESGRYTPEQIDRMLALVISAREELQRDLLARRPPS